MMQIGFVTFPRTPEEYVEFARINGFEHLEIDMHRHLLGTFNSERTSNLKESVISSSITLSVHAPYTLNLAERIPEIRKAYLNYYEKLIRLTASLDGKWLTAHLGYHIGFPNGKKKAVERAVDSLGFLHRFARELGVVLAVENVNPMPPRGEFSYIGDSLKEIETILETFDSEFMKLCLDLGHAHIAEGIPEYIHHFGERIVNVHVHDNRGVEDEHLPLGEGTIDWKQAFRLLKSADYNGPLTLEIYEDKEKIRSKNYIQKSLSELG